MTGTSTVVLCGDSTATRYGLPQASHPYASHLRRALVAEGVQLRSFARPSRATSATVAEMDRLVALDPSAVVLSHGGWEVLLRLPPALGVLRSHPRGAAPGGRPHRLRAIRWRLWAPLLALIERPWGERALARIGVRANVSTTRLQEDVDAALAQILSRTRARVILVNPAEGRMTVTPWSRTGKAALLERFRWWVRSDPRVELLDLTEELGPHHLNPDGVHLNTLGHETVGRLLLARLSTGWRQQDAGRPSGGYLQVSRPVAGSER